MNNESWFNSRHWWFNYRHPWFNRRQGGSDTASLAIPVVQFPPPLVQFPPPVVQIRPLYLLHFIYHFLPSLPGEKGMQRKVTALKKGRPLGTRVANTCQCKE